MLNECTSSPKRTRRGKSVHPKGVRPHYTLQIPERCLQLVKLDLDKVPMPILAVLSRTIADKDLPADVNSSRRVQLATRQLLESPVAQIKVVLVTPRTVVNSHCHHDGIAFALTATFIGDLDLVAALRTRRLVFLPVVG